MPSVVVTGASRGLGYAFLQHYAALPGYTAVGIVRDKEATEARLARDGLEDVKVLQADITDFKALQAAAAETSSITGGNLDLLINNAALVSRQSAWKTLLDQSPEDLEQDLYTSFQANVIGVAHSINAFLPLIRNSEMKKVITISTGMADDTFIHQSGIAIAAPYSISKSAVNTLVAKYNAALGSEGVLFMAISPGLVATDEGKDVWSEEDMQAMQAMGAKFAQFAPDFKGPITPKQSVDMVSSVIEQASVQTMGGQFVSHLGNKQWL